MARAKKFNHRLQVWATPEQAENVKRCAAEADLDMAEWLREAIDEKLRRETTAAALRGAQDTPPMKDFETWFMRMLDDVVVKRRIRQIVSEVL